MNSSKHIDSGISNSNQYGGTVSAPPPVVPNMNYSYADDPKQGSKCCGCCCDMRRAVMICDGVLVCLYIIATLIYWVGNDWIVEQYTTDDSIEDLLSDYFKALGVITVIGVVSAAVGILGAIKYNVWLVGLNVVYLVGGYVANIILTIQLDNDVNDVSTTTDVTSNVPGIIIGAVIIALWIYPHVGFIIEVRRGTMRPNTYAREEYSCCCV